MCTKELKSLAKEISKAGKIIAKDDISKDYTVWHNQSGSLIVRSDSGYEAIYIGNLVGNNSDGFMCLYTNNTSKRNSYPGVREIAELLLKVINKETLDTGEGKASYFDWKEYGGMEKQLNYFSELVKEIAGIK
ncbi:MAG: hypothetical protein K0R54_801 [Clostridiaceae bacterium]|jgi:hypothetical protein|nr:hypothetical protein [Clostridiaceae bacterium]